MVRTGSIDEASIVQLPWEQFQADDGVDDDHKDDEKTDVD